jgi:hypothetical protein
MVEVSSMWNFLRWASSSDASRAFFANAAFFMQSRALLQWKLKGSNGAFEAELSMAVVQG